MQWLRWVMLGFWLLVIVVTIIVEVSTVGLISGIATVAVIPSAFIAGFFGEYSWSIPVQIASAIVMWIILYFSIYKILKKWTMKFNKYRGPIEDLINEEVDLLSDAHEFGEAQQHYGKVILKGLHYRVLAHRHQGIIPKGTKVKVVKIEGNTLYVIRT